MMSYDPNYKMKYRPEPIGRLTRYTGWGAPPPMVGDPRTPRGFDCWEEHRRRVYEHEIARKNGLVPHEQRRGLWLYRDGERQ